MHCLRIFATAMFSIFSVTSIKVSMAVVAIIDLSWGLTLWVPFVLIAPDGGHEPQHSLSTNSNESFALKAYVNAGVLMELHNAAISLPQVTAAIANSLIFWLGLRCLGSQEAISWILRASGLAALGETYLGSKIEHK